LTAGRRCVVAGVACGIFCFLLSMMVFTDQKMPGRDSIPVEVFYLAWAALALEVLVSAGLFLWLRGKSAGYDPNDPETEQERIELGRSLTITREQATRLTGEHP
jgi:hypothetical protein